MRVHELKAWPAPFEAIVSGRKRHEIRRDDRGFAVGDELVLVEWDPHAGYSGGSTGRRRRVRVTYLSEAGTWGLPATLCVMSIELLDDDGGGR